MAPRINERFYWPIESNQEDYLLIPLGLIDYANLNQSPRRPAWGEIYPLIDKTISEHFDGTMREAQRFHDSSPVTRDPSDKRRAT